MAGTKMRTLKITADMLDENNVYVGPEDVSAWGGHVEIAAALGTIILSETKQSKERLQ